MLYKVATTSCESLMSERCLWNKLNKIVKYEHRRHRGLGRLEQESENGVRYSRLIYTMDKTPCINER